MTSALAKLMGYAGKNPEDFTKSSQVGKIFRRSGVKDSAELRRIIALPRREWSKDEPGFAELLADMQQWLRMPNGTMVLRPVQAKALAELHDYGGLFGPQSVGSGKTLVSLLSPIVLEAKRPLLVLPAKLRDKTLREIGSYQKHFRIVPPAILSYEILSRENGGKLLADVAPDLIITDECFPGNTLVLTDVGYIPIRDVVEQEKGTHVLSRSEGGDLEWRQIVRRLTRSGEKSLVKVTHDNGYFFCTAPHKIWTDAGYTKAEALRRGDHLRFLPEESARAESVRGNQGSAPILQQEVLSCLCSSSSRRQGPITKKDPSCRDHLQSLPEESQHRGQGEAHGRPLRSSMSPHHDSDGARLRADYLSLLPEGGECREERQEHATVLQSHLLGESPYGRSGNSGSHRSQWPQESHADVRGVREQLRSSPVEQAALLREPLCSSLEDAREASARRDIRADGRGHSHPSKGCGPSRHSKTDAREQPHGRSCQCVESDTEDEGSNLPRQGWQRPTDEATDTPGRSARISDRVRDLDCRCSRCLSPTMLQGRSSCSASEASHRGGRADAYIEEMEVLRPPQDRSSRISRVVSVEVLEPGSASEYLRSGSEDPRVYDLEVEGNHNYFADGVLVSNCHRLKNSRASVTRKITHWMKENPKTRFVALSGTITMRSLRDYAHILRWCLPYSSPLPNTQYDLEEWAAAIDEKIDDMQRLGVGALSQLCEPADRERIHTIGEHIALSLTRKAYQRRLTETPGVVATSESLLGASLSISAVQPRLGDELDAAFAQLRDDWETPDGHPVIDGFQLWRHARELACGFYYRWNPRPPEEWLTARRNWARFARDVLARHQPGLDSEMPIAKACARQELPDAEYNAWREIRDTFVPNQEAVWISDGTLQFAADWLKKNDGICWVEHIAFGERLAEMTGLSYYGGGGLDKGKRMIEDGKGPCIASILANSEGRNLQQWNKSLVVSCQPSGKMWEQLLGRTHREGQEADEVSYEVMFACKEQMDGFYQALADARYLQDTLGSPQKLLYADLELSLSNAAGPRWG